MWIVILFATISLGTAGSPPSWLAEPFPVAALAESSETYTLTSLSAEDPDISSTAAYSISPEPQESSLEQPPAPSSTESLFLSTSGSSFLLPISSSGVVSTTVVSLPWPSSSGAVPEIDEFALYELAALFHAPDAGFTKTEIDLADVLGAVFKANGYGTACSSNDDCKPGVSCVGERCGGSVDYAAVLAGGYPPEFPDQCPDDGFFCTTELTMDGVCYHVIEDEACCNSDADCSDQVNCTIDTCDPTTHRCINRWKDGCCTHGSQCVTDDFCVVAAGCLPTLTCYPTTLAANCCSPATCSDGDVCTADGCFGGECSHTRKEHCCATAADCDSGDCVIGTCPHPGGPCSYTRNPACCIHGGCDDSNICTLDSCIGGQCLHAWVYLCCRDDSDCQSTEYCPGPGQKCTLKQTSL